MSAQHTSLQWFRTGVFETALRALSFNRLDVVRVVTLDMRQPHRAVLTAFFAQGFVPEAATSHGVLPSLFRFLEAMREAICIHIGQGGAYHRCELSIRGQVWVLPVVKV